jgi:probable DNA metabolism protein
MYSIKMIPSELSYDGTLEGLFALLDRVCAEANTGRQDLPRRVRRLAPAWGALSPGPAGREEAVQAGLFAETCPVSPGTLSGNRAFPGFPPDPASLGGAARDLFEVSADAFDAFVYAWMSELPVEGEALRFGCKVLAAAEDAARVSGAGAAPWTGREAARDGAARAAKDRGDGDVRTVMDAAYKAVHEIDRLMGLLRFNPDPQGTYVARCAPDGFVVPALAGHFTLRFGGDPWVIIDEKRGILLMREAGREARLLPAAALSPRPGLGFQAHDPVVPDPVDPDPRDQDPWDQDPRDQDPWEKLWVCYHKAVNNEARKNPGLQRRFMPERYWQYLPELSACPKPPG